MFDIEENKQSTQAATLDTERDSFPEGGRQAWATVLGAFLMQFCGFGYTTAFGVFQDFYVRDYLSESSSSSISWIGSVNALLGVAFSVLSGPLFDRGYFRLVIYTGCLIQAASMFLLSLCQRQQLYQILLTQGVALGIGLGITYVPSVAVVSHYFQRRRSLVMALVGSGTPLGAIVHPILLNNTLHNEALGFGNAVRISAALNSALFLLACWLVCPRPLGEIQQNDGGGVHDGVGRERSVRATMRGILKDKPFLLAAAGMAFFIVAFWYPLFFLQLDAVKHGVGTTFAFYVLVIMSASGLVGRLLSGFLAEFFGVVYVLTVTAGCGTLLIFGMIFLRTIASIVVLAILNGFFAGIWAALTPSMLAYLTHDMSEVGLRMGIAFTIEGLVGLVGPPICGALLTSRFIWWRPALFSGILGVFGFALYLAIVIIMRRKESTPASKASRPIDPEREENFSKGTVLGFEH